MRRSFLLAFAICAGCSVIQQPSGMLERWTTSWRSVVTEDDRTRLANWRKSFVDALSAANRAGHAAEIAREGALLEPDAALVGPAIPNGMYHCRVIKLGAKSSGNLDYASYPNFTCRVRAEHTLQRLRKLDGPQRYVGIVFPNDQFREVFLGSLALGDESRAMQYGQDKDRDIAGYLERVGPARWRLVMPEPRFESKLDVMELVPASAGDR
jgi:hypothetical protein